MSYFYSKYIIIDSIIEELHGLDLSDEERMHLSQLLDSSLHHAILDEILSNLDEEDKKLFLKKLHEDGENKQLLEFLNSKIENVEDRVKKVADQLVKEMHQDIKESKRIKREEL